MAGRRRRRSRGGERTARYRRQRNGRGAVMRWLRGGVDDERDVLSEVGENLLDRPLVAHVHGVVPEVLERAEQAARVPVGRSVFAEEVFAHVVVNADDIESLGV